MVESPKDTYGEPLSPQPYKHRSPEFGVLVYTEKVEHHSPLVSGLYESQQLDLAFFTCEKGSFQELASLDSETLADFNYELLNHFVIEKPRLVLLKP